MTSFIQVSVGNITRMDMETRDRSSELCSEVESERRHRSEIRRKAVVAPMSEKKPNHTLQTVPTLHIYIKYI